MNKNDLTKYQCVIQSLFLFKSKKVLCLYLLTNLIACSSVSTRPPSVQTPTSSKQQYTIKPSYICQSPQSYAGTVVGDGQCVSFIKLCSHAPNTIDWSAGEKVLSQAPGTIPSGTIIATFKNGKYPSVTGYHAAISVSYTHLRAPRDQRGSRMPSSA